MSALFHCGGLGLIELKDSVAMLEKVQKRVENHGKITLSYS